MSDTRQILLDAAAKLFAQHFTQSQLEAAERGCWLAKEWAALEEFGLPLALVSEDAGGLGLPKDEALALVGLAAEYAIPLPLVETIFANFLLSESGIAVSAGAISLAPLGRAPSVTIQPTSNGWRINGVCAAVAWARAVDAIVVVATEGGQTHIAKVSKGGWSVDEEGITIGGLPSDRIRFNAELHDADVRRLSPTLPADIVLRGGAALRAIGMAGTLRQVLKVTVGYVTERAQFGRPLSKFQIIQQDIARIAAQATAATAAGDLAAEAFSRDFSLVKIAAAKARSGEAAGIAAALAHQLHGAIGVTQEYRLHYLTKQLWAWRDEFGHEGFWNEQLGRQALQSGGQNLWSFVTSAESMSGSD